LTEAAREGNFPIQAPAQRALEVGELEEGIEQHVAHLRVQRVRRGGGERAVEANPLCAGGEGALAFEGERVEDRGVGVERDGARGRRDPCVLARSRVEVTEGELHVSRPQREVAPKVEGARSSEAVGLAPERPRGFGEGEGGGGGGDDTVAEAEGVGANR
jgi:hypothetical protein